MKHFKYIIFSAITLLCLSNCKEEDIVYATFPEPDWKVDLNGYVDMPNWVASEESDKGAPDWKLNLMSDEAAPQWTQPDKGIFQFSMTAIVRLSDYLETYADDADQVAAFIGDECRGVGSVEVSNGHKLFFLYIKGNNAETEKVSLKYYSAKNKKMYTCKELLEFEQNSYYGTVETPEIAPFDLSGKYPRYMNATVVMPDNFTATPQDADVMAVFVDNDCRGVGELKIREDGKRTYEFEIRGTNEETQNIYFKYYSTEKNNIYKYPVAVPFVANSEFGTEEKPEEIYLLLENSMTAVVRIPDELQLYANTEDKLAAFIGDECCGVGKLTMLNDKPVYKMVIKSVDNPDAKVNFKYYSATNTYLYQTESPIDFKAESEYGTEAEPQTISISMSGKYPLKMTAVVALPSKITPYYQANDKLAAFVGNDCRGIGKLITNEYGEVVFFMEIIGSNTPDQIVHFKYYSTRNSYMYEDATDVTFEAFSQYGTEDNAIVLNLKNME
ncbi:hypothetical protein [Bacteroides sp.]